MGKDKTRAVRLDAQTDRLLTLMARRYEDNVSLTMRELIRAEAERKGILRRQQELAGDKAGGRP